MHSFTDRYLAEELAKLAHKGVWVGVYRDRTNFEQEEQWSRESTTKILLAAGIEVRVKGEKDLMHLKTYAIDGRLLRTGSATWSHTELERQDNDVLYELSTQAVEQCHREFQAMWARAHKSREAR